MNLKELRLGNWVNYDGDPCQITSHSFFGLQFSTIGLSPIPVTPEVLISCGFTKEADGHEYRIALPLGNGTDLCIETLQESAGPYDAVITDRAPDKKPHCYSYLKQQRWLHQLQNLYYSLTGEELPYNSPNGTERTNAVCLRIHQHAR